jgi:hypothetical protein
MGHQVNKAGQAGLAALWAAIPSERGDEAFSRAIQAG